MNQNKQKAVMVDLGRQIAERLNALSKTGSLGHLSPDVIYGRMRVHITKLNPDVVPHGFVTRTRARLTKKTLPPFATPRAFQSRVYIVPSMEGSPPMEGFAYYDTKNRDPHFGETSNHIIHVNIRAVQSDSVARLWHDFLPLLLHSVPGIDHKMAHVRVAFPRNVPRNFMRTIEGTDWMFQRSITFWEDYRFGR